MKRVIFMLCALSLLTGCSLTVPCKAQLDNGEINCTGTATGYIDSSGDLTLTCNNNMSCSGNFVYITSRYGKGNVTCTDNTSGTFEFTSTGTNGTGNGTIGGRPFTLGFGKKMGI